LQRYIKHTTVVFLHRSFFVACAATAAATTTQTQKLSKYVDAISSVWKEEDAGGCVGVFVERMHPPPPLLTCPPPPFHYITTIF
jgi:hypothetical protein